MEISVDIKAFSQSLLGVQKGLAEALPTILQGAALTTFAKIRNRIQETGVGNNGQAYPVYSQNELPGFFFEGKGNAKGKAAVKKAEKEGRGISYEEFKSANNGPASVKFRNLTLSGDMWRNIGITGTDQEKQGLVVSISGETQFAKNKMKYNSKQVGDFMSASKKEEAEATKDFQSEVDTVLKSINK